MYIPTPFKIQDPEKLAQFIELNSFATLITQADAAPFASHLPLLLDSAAQRLQGHMARANPQWQHFADSREVLAIFHGPHAYISPRWYQVHPAVPTWNYAVVHVYGKPSLITDETKLAELVKRTVRYYEGSGPDAWAGELPAEYESKMLKGIVGFELAITRIEGKFKLGQNRQTQDVIGVYKVLSESSHAHDRSLAELMKREGLAE